MIHYGFDGWLFNVENRIDPDKVPSLVDFVTKLTKATRKVKEARVIGKFLVSFRVSYCPSCILSVPFIYPNSTVEKRVW